MRTNWRQRWPITRVFTTLINEQIPHGAEIGLLRDYRRWLTVSLRTLTTATSPP